MAPKPLNINFENPNVDKFLFGLYSVEHGNDGTFDVGKLNIPYVEKGTKNVVTSTARGGFQFIKSTRDEILNKYGYDAWSDNIEEQKKATMALIISTRPEAATLIENGEFEKARKNIGGVLFEGLLDKHKRVFNKATKDKDNWSKIKVVNNLEENLINKKNKLTNYVNEGGYTVRSNWDSNSKSFVNVDLDNNKLNFYSSYDDINISDDETTTDAPNNKTKETKIPKAKTVSLDKNYRVYDNSSGKYLQINSKYNTETKQWSHKAVGDTDLNDKEIAEIGSMYTDPLGRTPKGSTTRYQKRTLEDGTVYYTGHSSDGEEQTSFQKRFSFFDTPPTQAETDSKTLKTLSDNFSKKTQGDNSIKSLEPEKNQALIKETNSRKQNLEKLNKKYLATRKPEDKIAYDKALEDYNKFISDNKVPTNNQLVNLTTKEKALRETLAEMQSNPDNFTEADIIDVQKKIDKVAIDMSVIQGNPRATGPFGHSQEQVSSVVVEDSDLEKRYSTEDKKVEPVGSTEVTYDDSGNISVEEAPAEVVEDKPVDETIETTEITSEIPEVVISGDDTDDVSVDDRPVVQEGPLAAIGGIGTVVSALVGAKALSQASKDPEILDMPEISEAFKAELYQAEQLSKQGFRPTEERAIRKGIKESYDLGVENAIRGTAGDRAKFLAMTGVLDSQRQSALLDFAAKDEAVRQQNKEAYNQMLNFKESYEKQNALQLRQEKMQQMQARQSSASALGAAALKTAMDNINNAKGDQMQRRYIASLTGDNVKVENTSFLDSLGLGGIKNMFESNTNTEG